MLENESNSLTPEEIVTLAVTALDDKKAADIKILHTAAKTVIADYFVICHGLSSTHIKALVDEVDKRLTEAGEPPIKREGARSDVWVLLDCGCVVVHIFTQEARQFYNLERLWQDSASVDAASFLKNS